MESRTSSYHSPPLKHVSKPLVAVRAGPVRSVMAWALVRIGKLSRFASRFVILRSAHLIICENDNPRSAILTVPIANASINVAAARFECLIRVSTHRVCIQWASDTELRACKAAFEFANRAVDDYFRLVTHRQLGKGRASEVVFAFDITTGDHTAVKIMNKDKARTTDREFAEKEILMRMTIQHPCIVQTLDIFETPYDLFVVMELMAESSLDRRLAKRNSGPLPEHEARVIMRRLFAALSHLHARNIAHRNVKPQNIFLDHPVDDNRWPDTAKLSDFSLACFLDDPDSSRQIVGTPEYLAPEASLMTRTPDGEREVVFGTEVDMWASGVTLYNILSMELPFEGDYPPEVFKKARSGKLPFSKRGFRTVSPAAISLIRALLNVDRRKRPTAATVLLHPWFGDYTTSDSKSYRIDGSRNVGVGGISNKSTSAIQRLRALSLADGTTDKKSLDIAHVVASLHNDNGSWCLALFRGAATAVLAMNRIIARTPGLQMRPTRKVEKRFDFNVSGIDIAPIRTDMGGRSDLGNGIASRPRNGVSGSATTEAAGAMSANGRARKRTSGTMMSRISTTGSSVRSSVGDTMGSGGMGVTSSDSGTGGDVAITGGGDGGGGGGGGGGGIVRIGGSGVGSGVVGSGIVGSGIVGSGVGHGDGGSGVMQRSDGQSDYFGRATRGESFGSGSVIGVHRLMSDTAGLVAGEERGNWRWRRRGRRDE